MNAAFMCDPDESAGQAEQLALTQLHPCNVCHGRGFMRDRDGEAEDCPTCQGAGTVDYDPDDRSQVPF